MTSSLRRLKQSAFLQNLALFFFVFLPTVAIVSMVLNAALGDRVESSPEWEIGWNPLIWFIMTAPWLLPAVVVVPLVHFLGKAIANRFSPATARLVILGASPALFLLAVLLLWDRENFRMEFVVPVAAAGVLYGALQRIPVKPAS